MRTLNTFIFYLFRPNPSRWTVPLKPENLPLEKHEESVPYLEMSEDKRNKLPAGVKHTPCEVLQKSDDY